MEQYDIVVAGAGASGLIAAVRAAELGAHVLVLEKMDRAGRKLLITGKGRCNITNMADQNEYYKHIYPRGRFLKHAFSRFFTQDIIKLLEDQGVVTTVERGGRVFPVSNSSADVLNALITQAKAHEVSFRFNCQINQILTEHHRVIGVEVLHHGQQELIRAKKIIICTGGKSYPATGSTGDGYTLAKEIGHTVTPVNPALVPLVTREDIEAHLHDLTLKNVQATLWIDGKKQKEEFGEMCFTPYGLSGPSILTLSRTAVGKVKSNSEVKISIDLKPALDEKKLDNRLLRDLNEHAKKQMGSLFKMWLPSAMIPLFTEKTGISPSHDASQITARERREIKMLMKSLTFSIKGPRSFREAIITAGGIPTNEIDSGTMESKIIKNLHFAGELIDLDADTGGYNLQIAWSTGWLAGEAAARNST